MRFNESGMAHRIFAKTKKGIGLSPNHAAVPKQKAEVDFWKLFYKEVSQESSISRVSAVGPLEKRPEYKLTDKQWAKLDPRSRLLELSRTMAFPRYKNDLSLDGQALEGQVVLDVGCGPMGALHWFNAKLRVGLDELLPQQKNIGYPLQDHAVSYVQGVGESMPFLDCFFDAVISVMLWIMWRILKP